MKKVALLLILLTTITSCVTVKIYIVQNGRGQIKNSVCISDPDTVTSEAKVTGQKNF